jgi:hypothetical protein
LKRPSFGFAQRRQGMRPFTIKSTPKGIISECFKSLQEERSPFASLWGFIGTRLIYQIEREHLMCHGI